MLRTARLALRRFTTSDVDLLVELDSDPEVMRFITGGVPTPRAIVERDVLPGVLRDYERLGGLGWWAAELLGERDGEFVGWLGLRPPGPDRLDEPELGYRLRRAAWGRGLASEGARALVDRAFRDLGARRVFAQTMAVNTASRRVMERAGLTYLRTLHPHFDDPIPGTEHGEVEYELQREDWRWAAEGGPDPEECRG